MVAIVGGLVVFLLGCCLVMLAAIHLRLSDQGARADAAAEQRAEEDRRHRDAAAAIVVGAMRDVGAAIVRELERAARERRDTVQQLLHVASGPDAEERDGWPTGPIPSVRPPRSSRPPVSQPRPVVKPGAPALPPGAPTLKSGQPLFHPVADEEAR